MISSPERSSLFLNCNNSTSPVPLIRTEAEEVSAARSYTRMHKLKYLPLCFLCLPFQSPVPAPTAFSPEPVRQTGCKESIRGAAYVWKPG